MTDKEYVLSIYPDAACSGPHKVFWPGQGERIKHVVTSAPHMNRHEGEGDTEESAWSNARLRIQTKRRIPATPGEEMR